MSLVSDAMSCRVGRFTAGYLVLFGAWSAGRGDRRFLAYVVVVGGLAAALRAAHRAARFSPMLCGALAVCGLLHLSGGLLPSPTPGAAVLYETWLVPELVKFDQLVHFTITAVLTVALWHLLGGWIDAGRCGPWGRALLAVLASLGWGGLNEAFEFLSTLRLDNFVGGLDNTGWDLVFNAFGALAAGAWLACASPPRSTAGAPDRAAPIVDLRLGGSTARAPATATDPHPMRDASLVDTLPPARRSRAAGSTRWK